MAVAIFGFYFYGLKEQPQIRRIFAAGSEKAERIYSLCGVLFEVFGISAALVSVLGFYAVSFGLSIAVFVLNFIYANLVGRN